MLNKKFFLLALLPIMFFSCKHEDPKPVIDDSIVGKGVFVLNEGSYSYANASLTFYNPERDTVANDLFYKVNAAPIGDVGQSLALADNKLYIVSNNSNHIYKVNAKTMKYESKIDQFVSPREMMVVAPNKAYVSDLASPGLWIVNPVDMTHCGSVDLGKAAEKMLMVGNELYVSNWSNFYVYGVDNNTVQVVDVNNNVKVSEIQVGKEPNCMALDKDNHVWVLCEGASWDTISGETPSLWCIDPMLKTATRKAEFPGYVSCLASNKAGTALYFLLNGDLCRFDIEQNAVSTSFRIAAEGRTFYNIVVNPENDEIYVTDVKDYMQNGKVYRYSSDGVLLSSFDAGIIPHAMVFN
ncbi:MAG: hypothetical protein HUK16_04880 [Bacteroidales bacterium]|nr:hypothetical protein [Bacteroidales bacterium]